MFIDTNVLVNSRILEAPQHLIARLHLERAFSGDEPLTISRQIIREYLAVVTRPQIWPVPITYDQALEDANALLFTKYPKMGPSSLTSCSICAQVCRSAAGRFMTPTSWRRCSHTASAGC